STLGRVVHEFQGTVGEFTEAGVVVLFNDPLPCPEPALSAARMTLAMREQLQPLVVRWQRHGLDLDFCAGLDTGFATLGVIGFEGRYDYAAVGRVVRVGRRLSEHAAAGQILVSERVAADIAAEMATIRHDPLQLDGMASPVVSHV